MARASLGLYTTREDLEALLAGVRDLVERRDEILSLYEPVGSNGYRHTRFGPAPLDLFDPERLLDNYLAQSA
jgi:hypothetical protein